jgi:exodeoxyribonuclease-3
MTARRADSPTRILSWNVNGLRACAKKGFGTWLDASDAEIVGIQEVRAEPAQIPSELRQPSSWNATFSVAERKGYSGVGLYTRRPPDRIDTTLGDSRFDAEGRVQIARFGRLALANVYFPNGNGKDRDNSRVPYKLEFYGQLFDRLQRLRRSGARVLVMGDFNTAHREIDLARPRENRQTSGFLPEECAEIDRWIDAGWIDTYRHFDPSPDRYTWWSQRFGVRNRNVGWRIDYVLASPAAMTFIRRAMIYPDVQGSDHCPIGVEVDPAIFR